MADTYLAGKHILAVDDERDVLDIIEESLGDSRVDFAMDYESAREKLNNNVYDLVILDIMGVSGLKLLDEAVARNFPAVILTAHAVNPETLLTCIQKGAIAYLPKEKLSELSELLTELLSSHDRGEPPWKLLFERLGEFFDERFGPGWKDKEQAFWSEFSRTYQIGKGIQARLLHDERVTGKGV